MADLGLPQIRKLYGMLILPFYKLKRDLYIPTENNRPENDAEHSWSLAFMALMLAPRIDEGLDVNKAVSYALIHDLVEVYAGDTSVFASPEFRGSKTERESAAFQKIRSDTADFPHLARLLEAYDSKADSESRFVYALDKFHNWMTAYMGGDYYYKKINKIDKETAYARMEESLTKARSFPAVAGYLEKLIMEFKRHPENFYEEEKR